MSTSRVADIAINAKENGELNITVLSDVHYESPQADIRALERILKKRSQLPNHRVIIIGDLFDLIVPSDRKRYYPHCTPSWLSGVDAFVNSIIESAAEFFVNTGAIIDVVGIGNHEEQFKKHHHVDVAEMFVEKYNKLMSERGSPYKAQLGGYFGVCDYNILWPGKIHSRFRVMYHHGAWRGEDNAGLGGAKRFFLPWPDWDVAVYGDSHDPVVKPEVRPEICCSRKGPYKKVIRYKKVYFVNAGSWTYNFMDDARMVSFLEMKGKRQHAHVAPLITVRIRRPESGLGRFLVHDVEVMV